MLSQDEQKEFEHKLLQKKVIALIKNIALYPYDFESDLAIALFNRGFGKLGNQLQILLMNYWRREFFLFLSQLINLPAGAGGHQTLDSENSDNADADDQGLISPIDLSLDSVMRQSSKR